ncbi:MAG: Ig-like domain-containing protein, partial [Actinobacteria bacterium]|nr:Ig-like domain-containing protein [Actinomycetota bacterium]
IIQNFLAGTDGDLPLAFICADALGAPYGHFDATLHLTATKATTGTWTQTNAVLIARTATTTSLTATPATAEVGSPVALSASVSAAGATGSIEFFDGTTSLGTSTIAAGTAGLSVSSLSVGTHSITATYLGDTGYETSTSAASSVEITPVAARETTTTLAADVVSGAPYQNVTLTASVTASLGTPAGTVTFKDGATVLGSAPVDATGVATLTKNTLGAGAHALTAVFTGSAPYSDSTSTEVAAAYTATGATDEQTVTVDIPAGAITITTPYTEASPLSLGIAVLDSSDSTYSASAKFGDATDAAKAIKITDTRAGSTGFVAQVQSGDFTNGTSTFGGKYAGLTGVQAIQLAGNALQATDIVPTDHVAYTDGLESAKVFATYHPAVPTLGTALLEGTFSVDQVPSSVTPGTYTATVIFTAN